MPRTNSRSGWYSYSDEASGSVPTPAEQAEANRLAEQRHEDRLAEMRDQEERDFLEMEHRDFNAQRGTENDPFLALARTEAAASMPAVVTRRMVLGALVLNKTQLRELMAHSNVWERVPTPLRTRIVNSVASDGVLFQLTNNQRTELRNALNHARARRPISARLQAIFNQSHRWS